MTTMDARVYVVLLAGRMVGDYLYAWGGESREEGGFDCSGYASTVLSLAARAWPSLYDGGRRTAQGLYDYFHSRGAADIVDVEDLEPGSLVFYRRPGRRIHHVAIHAVNIPSVRLDDGLNEFGPLAFEAGGSGSGATTPRAALLASAGVRMSASDYHGRGVEWVAKDLF